MYIGFSWSFLSWMYIFCNVSCRLIKLKVLRLSGSELSAFQSQVKCKSVLASVLNMTPFLHCFFKKKILLFRCRTTDWLLLLSIGPRIVLFLDEFWLFSLPLSLSVICVIKKLSTSYTINTTASCPLFFVLFRLSSRMKQFQEFILAKHSLKNVGCTFDLLFSFPFIKC